MADNLTETNAYAITPPTAIITKKYIFVNKKYTILS